MTDVSFDELLTLFPPKRYDYDREEDMNSSDQRDLRQNRSVSERLSVESWDHFKPMLRLGILWQRDGVQGRVHLRNLQLWENLIESDNIDELKFYMTTLKDEGINMRQVSPVVGVGITETRERLGIKRTGLRTREEIHRGLNFD